MGSVSQSPYHGHKQIPNLTRIKFAEDGIVIQRGIVVFMCIRCIYSRLIKIKWFKSEPSDLDQTTTDIWLHDQRDLLTLLNHDPCQYKLTMFAFFTTSIFVFNMIFLFNYILYFILWDIQFPFERSCFVECSLCHQSEIPNYGFYVLEYILTENLKKQLYSRFFSVEKITDLSRYHKSKFESQLKNKFPFMIRLVS
jgi:hypothetical protein